MPALPPVSDFTGTDRTNAQMRVTHAALHAYLVGLLGSDGATATALAALGALGAPGVTTRTAATTLVAADRGRIIQATSGTWALTLPGAAAVGAGWAVLALNGGAGTITLTRAGSDLIDGAATAALAGGQAALVLSTGTGWITLTLGGAASAGRALRATDVTTSATDTTAGRLSKVGDFGLGSLNPRTSGVILNNWLSTSEPTGFHTMGTDAETLNKPTGLAGAGFGGALTVRANDVQGARIGWRSFRNATEFFMQKWDSGGMGWLLKFFNNRNIVGTVVDAAGVPDGAIIETGSNANGRYTRFADGTQMCSHILSTSNTAGVTWTFPAIFAASPTPRVVGTPVASVMCSAVLDSLATTTSVVLSARGASDDRLTVSLNVTAIGRWF